MRPKAVITGATGGLGRAFAWEFARRGWSLALTDRSTDALELLAAGVSRAHDTEVGVIACDLSVDSDRNRLTDALRDAAHGIDALVNVAGFDSEGPFVQRDISVLVKMMRVNKEAGIVLTHALASSGSRDRPLRVINTASLAACYPMPFKATYAASKGFVLSSSLALREELRGVATITVLCPAGMPTTEAAREAIDDQGLIGRVTTVNASDAVRMSIDAALHGRPTVIPGWANRLLYMVSKLIPQKTLASLIARRWGAARGYTPSEHSEEPAQRRAS